VIVESTGLIARVLPAAPLPVNVTFCGEPLPELVTVRLPFLVPEALGENVTEIEQFAPAPSDEPQLLVCPKSPAAVIDEIVTAALPVFDNVTACCGLVVPTIWLPKVRLATESWSDAVVPVPVSETVWGEPAALVDIDSDPLREPDAVGLNFTVMVQLEPTASDVPQLFVCEKSPDTRMLEIERDAVPVLLTVSV
jgi:hypothetical protein